MKCTVVIQPVWSSAQFSHTDCVSESPGMIGQIQMPETQLQKFVSISPEWSLDTLFFIPRSLCDSDVQLELRTTSSQRGHGGSLPHV